MHPGDFRLGLRMQDEALTESEALDILRSFDVNPSFGPSSSWVRSARIARTRQLDPSLVVPPPVLAALSRFPHLDVPPRHPPRGPKTVTTGPYILSLCPGQKRPLPAQDVKSQETSYANRKRRCREEQNQLVATLDVLLPPEARCGGA
jgi:hypothetical protein